MKQQDRIIELLMALDAQGLLDDPEGQALKQSALYGFTPMASEIQELHRRANKLNRDMMLGNTIPFREPKLSNHGICLGQTPKGRWVHQDLTRSALHFATIGTTGSAKSSAWMWLSSQFFLSGIGFFGLDLYKQDLRHLVHAAKACKRVLSVLTHHDLRFNPLEPDGVDPAQHLHTSVSQLCRALEIPDRASMLLREAAHQEYTEAGVFNGHLDHCPTLFHLYERVKYSSGNPAAREALLDRLGSLLMSLGPTVLSYHRAWRPSQMLDRLVVLELAGATETIKQYLPVTILSSMFAGQVSAGVTNSRLRTVVYLDDAQRFLSGDGIGSRDQTPIAELLGLLRSSGISVAASYQSFDGVSSGIMANMSCRLIGRLGCASDWKRAAHELSLNPQQLAWAQGNLKPGTFLLHLPFAEYRHPFVATMPRPNLLPVSDADLIAGKQELDQLPVIPCTKFMHWTPWGGGGSARTKPTQPKSPPTVPHSTPATSSTPTAPSEPSIPRLTDRERRLLLAVVDNPFQPASSYHKVTSMKPADSKRAREALIGYGYITARKARLHKPRGRQPLILEPTAAGKKLAELLRERSP